MPFIVCPYVRLTASQRWVVLMHIFGLTPSNAKAIVRALRRSLMSHANPEHKTQYLANADKFAKKLDMAVSQVKAGDVRPYWAYHDAYQIFRKISKAILYWGTDSRSSSCPQSKSNQMAFAKSSSPNHVSIVTNARVETVLLINWVILASLYNKKT